MLRFVLCCFITAASFAAKNWSSTLTIASTSDELTNLRIWMQIAGMSKPKPSRIVRRLRWLVPGRSPLMHAIENSVEVVT